MVRIPRLAKGKGWIEALVKERKRIHEQKLEVSRLRETLVLEEFDVNVEDAYDFSGGKAQKEIGGFGEVQVVRHRQTGTKCAMKTVALTPLKSKAAFDRAMQEVDLLKSLDHPNIVRLQEVYVTSSRLYIAMDLVEGGNLAVRYVFEGEDKAAHIVRQVVRALRYLHDHNIAHRDLKLENILLEHAGPGAAVKLVDFGLSAVFEKDCVSDNILGSWGYVAPEVIRGKSRPAEADMWSLGVVTYVLLSGRRPFDDVDIEKIKSRILAARYGFKGKAWANASENSKHFVRSLLQKTPRLRLPAARAQEHRWLRRAEELSQTPPADHGFAERMTRSLLDFREARPMKQLALEVVARTLDPAQIRRLAQEFDRADKTNDGEVSLAEFKNWMAANESARGMCEEDIEALFNSIDVDGSGLIHFNEFLAATIPQGSLDETRLKAAFDRLDRSHTGFISVRDLTLMTGAAANAEESAVLMKEFDFKGDGHISFEEFVEGMRRVDPEKKNPELRILSGEGSPLAPPSPPSAPSAFSAISEVRHTESTDGEKTSRATVPTQDAGSTINAPIDRAGTPTRVASDGVVNMLTSPSSPPPGTQAMGPAAAPTRARMESSAEGNLGVEINEESRVMARANGGALRRECSLTGGRDQEHNIVKVAEVDVEDRRPMRCGSRNVQSEVTGRRAEVTGRQGLTRHDSGQENAKDTATVAVASGEMGDEAYVSVLPLAERKTKPPAGCCVVS